MFQVTITAEALHIRKRAGMRFDSLGLLKKDAVMSVLDMDSTGTWLQVKQSGKAGLQGWCSARYLLPVLAAATAAPWVEIAFKEIGIKEYAGSDLNHPRIQQYLATVNDLSAIDKTKDETAWCSCFMNWCVEQAGMHGTDSAWAKSWGNWRTSVNPDKAQAGDIAVFDRSSATSSGGHVGILMDIDMPSGVAWVLGGNQTDSVRHQRYPINGVMPNGTQYKLLSCHRM